MLAKIAFALESLMTTNNWQDDSDSWINAATFQNFVRSTKGDLKMSTEIDLPRSIRVAPPSTTATRDTFNSKAWLRHFDALGIRDAVGWRVRALRSAPLRIEHL
jgi:hypothetical protein